MLSACGTRTNAEELTPSARAIESSSTRAAPVATEREPATEPAVERGAGDAPPELAPASRGAHGPWTTELRLARAPFAEPRAPSVVVHAPPRFDPAKPLRLVVFLHGYSGCARVLAYSGPTSCRDGERAREGWDLATRFDDTGSDALFIVPQLAFLVRDGSPGAFVEEGRFRSFLEELIAALEASLGDATLARVESISLLAHSAGFETAIALVTRGGIEIDHVVLFDALYRGVEPFTSWVASDPDHRLVSLYTGGRTEQQNQMLDARTRALLGAQEVAVDATGALGDLVRAHRVTIARTRAPHAAVPARHMAEIAVALGLSARP